MICVPRLNRLVTIIPLSRWWFRRSGLLTRAAGWSGSSRDAGGVPGVHERVEAASWSVRSRTALCCLVGQMLEPGALVGDPRLLDPATGDGIYSALGSRAVSGTSAAALSDPGLSPSIGWSSPPCARSFQSSGRSTLDEAPYSFPGSTRGIAACRHEGLHTRNWMSGVVPTERPESGSWRDDLWRVRIARGVPPGLGRFATAAPLTTNARGQPLGMTAHSLHRLAPPAAISVRRSLRRNACVILKAPEFV